MPYKRMALLLYYSARIKRDEATHLCSAMRVVAVSRYGVGRFCWAGSDMSILR